MNELSNLPHAIFCPKCTEKNPDYIAYNPEASIVCPFCGYNYFPFKKRDEASNLPNPPVLGF